MAGGIDTAGLGFSWRLGLLASSYLSLSLCLKKREEEWVEGEG